ncbi:MAG: hypothetical protein R3B90_16440 [Planctomycetaceae bacterium]
MNKCSLVALLAVLATGTVARSDDAPPAGTLDLIPASEVFGIYARNLNELARDGDALIKEVGVNSPWRPSTLIEFALNWAKLHKGVDRDRPVGGTFLAPESQVDPKPPDLFENLVVVAPATSREQIAGNYQIAADAAGVVEVVGQGAGPNFPQLAKFHQDHLLVSGWSPKSRQLTRDVLEAFSQGDRLRAVVSDREAETLGRADLLMHLGVGKLMQLDPKDDWMQRELDQLQDPDEQAIGRAVQSTFQQVEHAIFGIDLNDGARLESRFYVNLDRDPVAVPCGAGGWRRFGRSESVPPLTLAGLPNEPVVAALASRLATPRRRLIVKTIGKLLGNSNSGLGSIGLFGAVDDVSLTEFHQTVLLGSFEEIAAASQGLRMAIYPNGDGTFAVIAIFDTDHPDELIGNVRALAELATPGTLPGVNTPPTLDDAAIRQLVRELGADAYLVRSRATTRLALLGERAEPALEAATQSGDVELAARAQHVLQTMRTRTQRGEAALLENRTWRDIEPTFVFHDAAEEHGGQAVDVIQLKLPEQDQRAGEQMATVLGPEWDRVRLAKADGALIVTFGTIGTRLAQTIRLVNHNEPGLAAAGNLPALPPDPHRLVQLHLPLSRMIAEQPRANRDRNEVVEPSTSLTVLGFSVASDRFAFDAYAPLDEVRVIVNKRGWW